MSATGLIDDIYVVREIIGRVVIGGYTQGPLVPLERVTIDERYPAHRRCHRVAVQVLYVTHGHIDRLFIDLAVRHIEVDQQLIAVERPIEVHLRQLTVIPRRSIGYFVRKVLTVGGQNQRNNLVHDIAVTVPEDTLVVAQQSADVCC